MKLTVVSFFCLLLLPYVARVPLGGLICMERAILKQLAVERVFTSWGLDGRRITAFTEGCRRRLKGESKRLAPGTDGDKCLADRMVDVAPGIDAGSCLFHNVIVDAADCAGHGQRCCW